ncbi:MAG: hypothetical protein A3E78_04270 [Alphaproteobacteria bacterium RIFCSPHIGHO2_12_FULL_63_12]|nr:MAG: hypothetical protein A3E78_04270 [Alphaproteobacteria bacterium RIFCSPHIGHO2_12_FULL_63_12]
MGWAADMLRAKGVPEWLIAEEAPYLERQYAGMTAASFLYSNPDFDYYAARWIGHANDMLDVGLFSISYGDDAYMKDVISIADLTRLVQSGTPTDQTSGGMALVQASNAQTPGDAVTAPNAAASPFLTLLTGGTQGGGDVASTGALFGGGGSQRMVLFGLLGLAAYLLLKRS